MLALLLIVIAGLLALVLAYWRAPAALWALAYATLLAFAVSQPEASRHVVAAAALIALLVVVTLPGALRRRVLAAPLRRAFRRRMPALSASEREALGAGSVWWDGELLTGDPDWRRLRRLAPVRLSAAEQAFLDGPVRTVCALIDEWQVTRVRHDLPPEVWAQFKADRFFGLIIPERWGGLGFSAAAHSAVVARLTSHSPTAAITVMVPNALGPAELLLRYGTEAQRAHWLPRLARGEELPCFALTGPQAGSDAASIPDRGVVCYGTWQGREHVLGMRLTWEKRYITLAPVATVLGLAFRLRDPDRLLGADEDLGITLALVPTTTPGVTTGRRHWPMDAAFLNGPTSGHEVFVPLDCVIGGPERVGQGWAMLMNCLAEGRAISLPANACGVAQRCAHTTGAYAVVRRQFGLPLARFEGIEAVLARIAGNTYVMEAARRVTLQALDAGEHSAVVSAIVKYHLTERARSVVNDAMDVHGGKAICLGPSNLLAQAYQQVPIAITVEGANILLRSMMIFGQGLVRGHPWLRRELEACEETDDGALARFDAALFGHVRFFAANAARALWWGLAGGRARHAARARPERRHYAALTRFAAALAFTADVALLSYGGTLKRRERISARLADVLGLLYLGSCVLKHFEDAGRPADDRPLLDWAMADTCARLETALAAVYANFEPRPLGAVLRRWVLPRGRRAAPGPDDRMDAAVARILTTAGPARDRLFADLHRSGRDDDPAGRLDAAWEAAQAAAPAYAKLRSRGLAPGQPHAGLLDEAETQALERAQRLARDVIEVDDFPPDLAADGAHRRTPAPDPRPATTEDCDEP